MAEGQRQKKDKRQMFTCCIVDVLVLVLVLCLMAGVLFVLSPLKTKGSRNALKMSTSHRAESTRLFANV